MKNQVKKLYERMKKAFLKIHETKTKIEFTQEYVNANSIMMGCMLDGEEPTDDELNFVINVVKEYEGRALSMG